MTRLGAAAQHDMPVKFLHAMALHGGEALTRQVLWLSVYRIYKIAFRVAILNVF